MKKNFVWIIIIVILVVCLLIALWAIAYSYFSNRVNNATRQGFIDNTLEYLNANEDFLENYGTPISIESENKFPVENKTDDLTEYYMDFTCVTDKGKFNIRVYHLWSDDSWSYRFEDLNNS